MCGICGFVSRKDIALEQLREMDYTMYHRGPDDHGEEIYGLGDGYRLGMAQRRLSIQDLSPMGHQPMHSPDRRISLVFNGEIYNFRELKKELTGYPFCSSCDTEVIIAAYLKWGVRCVERFHGMFAVALYDAEKSALYLMRDRIGKKPLYYWYEGGDLVFASELKPIMACPGFHKRIDRGILARYLYQQYIKAPDSIFENVHQLAPGSILKFASGKIHVYKYWDVKKVYHEKKGTGPRDYLQAKRELGTILESAVRQRMIADVPLGTFLSGGYDSSLVTALAQKCSSTPVKTFSIGFYDETYDEAVSARQIAAYLGTVHTERYIDEQDMLRLVDSIPRYFDEPFADSSQIPTMLVSELARQDVTVALSGDGGDEFFCGYDIYQKLALAQRLDLIGGIVHAAGKIAGLEEHYPARVRAVSRNRDKETKTQLISDNYLRAVHKIAGDSGRPCLYDMETMYGEHNWQERRMLLDMDTYLPGDILCKVDRAAMKYSLETRCPILDTDVMEYAFSIPHSFKYRSGVKKRILKDIAHDHIPAALLERPKKGFSVPLDKWLRGPLREKLLDLTQRRFLESQGLFDAAATESFVRKYIERGDAGPGTGANYSRIVWALLMFQCWYQVYEQDLISCQQYG